MVGSLIYTRNGDGLSLESTSFGGGGRIGRTSGGYEVSYFVGDHLGSTRAVVRNGQVAERSDYYPYGLRWDDPAAPVSTNRWLYNGKELQTTGLPSSTNYLDYGARILDARMFVTLKNKDGSEDHICIGDRTPLVKYNGKSYSVDNELIFLLRY